MESDNRPCDQLREEADEEQQFGKAYWFCDLAPIAVDSVGDELKSEERDSRRQYDIAEQVEALVADFGSIDPDRLAQEAAVVMTKADVRENWTV